MSDNYNVKDAAGSTIAIRAKEITAGIFSNFVHLMVGGTEVDASNPLPVRGLITNPSATLELPNSTTTYAIGDLVANSATAGSVNPLTFTVTGESGGSFIIVGLSVKSNRLAATTLGSFRLHLYSAAPTVETVGDDGVFGDNVNMGSARYLGAFDFSLDRKHKDGYGGVGIPILRPYVPIKLASGTTIRGLVEARANYPRTTPGGNPETLEITLDVLPNS
jgi:hypothetical protein